ncbi:MAG: SurA N-terminal domain-containing protein [Candidatus Saccharibacteria bacterium]|nr:SurA N-terminal domain-containing protein [Candidatus Saccharibacteria bacterium]
MAFFKKKSDDKKTEREKVEERREEVLARGRKFKYPLQYAKHKVVNLTILISALAVITAGSIVYLMLYQFQSTDDLLFRITQVVPFSVAKIDDEKVLYSDYLLIYRSTITPIEKQGMVENGQNAEDMTDYYKRQALTSAEDYTYAIKLARELNITVSDSEVNDAVEKHRKAGGVERSQETFVRVLQDNFGLSLSEYKRIIYLSLISEKVSEEIDQVAKSTMINVKEYLSERKSLKEISEILGEKVVYEETGGLVDRMNVDGGRATVAMTLEKGQTSERFVSTSGDGIYFVTLLDKTESTVNYISLHIPFTELNTRLEAVRKENKVEERIIIEEQKNDEKQPSEN